MDSSASVNGFSAADAAAASGTQNMQANEERLKEEFFKFFAESEIIDLVLEDDEE